MATASFSFSFQCLATFSDNGSSGLGALRSAWMLQAEAPEHQCPPPRYRGNQEMLQTGVRGAVCCMPHALCNRHAPLMPAVDALAAAALLLVQKAGT